MERVSKFLLRLLKSAIFFCMGKLFGAEAEVKILFGDNKIVVCQLKKWNEKEVGG